jgi:hypothetical protein
MEPRRLPAPFWIFAGFVLGVGFGRLAFWKPEPPPYVAPPLVVQAAPVRAEGPTLREIEAEFTRLRDTLVWQGDVATFAVPGPGGAAVAVEAYRATGVVSFRPAPRDD